MAENPIQITWFHPGQVPSKSNFKWQGKWKDRKRRWGRIEDAEREIGEEALAAWRAEGGKGSMLKHSYGKHVVVQILCVRQRIDANNAPKLICDSLEGICYENDREVESRSKMSKDQSGEPGVWIRVAWVNE